MDNNKEPAEGSYYDRENKRNEHKAFHGRLKTVRRALMYTGGGLLALILAKGALSGPVQPGTLEQNPNRPAPTETINPEIYSQLLERHPDAVVHQGGKIIINFEPYRNSGLLPGIRGSAEITNDRDTTNLISGVRGYNQINNEKVDLNKHTSLEINNFITVTGNNPDNSSDPNSKGMWIAVELSAPDGSTILGFISKSYATSGYVNIEEGGDLRSLDLFTGSSELKNFNKTTVISNNNNK